MSTMDNYVLVSAHNFSWNRKYLIWYTCQWLDKCACLYLCTVKNDTNQIAFGIACHGNEHTIRYTNGHYKRNISLSLIHGIDWHSINWLFLFSKATKWHLKSIWNLDQHFRCVNWTKANIIRSATANFYWNANGEWPTSRRKQWHVKWLAAQNLFALPRSSVSHWI